jgi:TonB-dependent SusC/RagA subfamily outer membrane receptor
MNKYLLHINEPCSQNWDEMTATEKGKFCSSCKKTVFDFTTATDSEIVKHIEVMKAEIFCGNFEKNQLDRWINSTNVKTSNKKLYEFLLSLTLIASSQNVYAQESTKKAEIELRKIKDSLDNIEAIKAETPSVPCDSTLKSTTAPTKIILRGAITSINSNHPLIILDGVPIKDYDLSKLDVKKIKSVMVLKPAQASAIYGSDAFNGAIIVTSIKKTKQKSRKKFTQLNK